ncbi:MAG: hypothetical protein WC551_07565 [Patescibacteria group bacterium]
MPESQAVRDPESLLWVTPGTTDGYESGIALHGGYERDLPWLRAEYEKILARGMSEEKSGSQVPCVISNDDIRMLIYKWQAELCEMWLKRAIERLERAGISANKP